MPVLFNYLLFKPSEPARRISSSSKPFITSGAVAAQKVLVLTPRPHSFNDAVYSAGQLEWPLPAIIHLATKEEEQEGKKHETGPRPYPQKQINM